MLFLLIGGRFQYVQAQHDSLGVSFIAYWSPGDIYEFKITKIKQEWNEAIMTKNDSSQYVAQFEVLDSTESSYKIKWRFKDGFLRKYNIPKWIFEKIAKYEIDEIVYTTTELGEFVEIENWKSLGTKMKAFAIELMKLEDPEINKKELQHKMAPIFEMYESKEGLEQLFFKEILHFHEPFGGQYPAKEIIEYKEAIITPISEEPIKVDAKLFIDSIDFDKKYCILINETKLNPDDTKRALLGFFNRLDVKKDEIETALKTTKLDISDYFHYEYYYDPGIPIKIEINRKVIMDIVNKKNQGIEKMIIERIE